jgi:hypothetical protein
MRTHPLLITLCCTPLLSVTPSARADDPAAPTEPPEQSAPTPVAKPDAKPEKPAPTKSDLGHSAVSPAPAFPHPLLTEVLFAVPTGESGDANKDGKREVSGDEFIELVNPHDRSIDLRGYTLTDAATNPKSLLKFTFPSILIPPHGVVVVFNGHDSKIPAPVGDAKHAPASVNDTFSKAAVFSMHITGSRVSFSNANDAACLFAPDKKPLQRVRWGKADEKSGGTNFILDEIAPTTSKGSVQRDGLTKEAAWKVHTEIDATPFSPGAFPFPAPTAPQPATTPTAPASTKPEKTATP